MKIGDENHEEQQEVLSLLPYKKYLSCCAFQINA
jgi:hypothetical protein